MSDRTDHTAPPASVPAVDDLESQVRANITESYGEVVKRWHAAEARAREAEGEAMKWRGLWSAYRQTEPQEQTRGVIFGELDHHWREVTDDPIAVEARAATSQLRELERQQLHAAQARIAELERERAALAERIRGIPLPYAVVPLNDAFQAALHAAAALVEQKARAAINPQPESERE
jgi:hypothetical protein